MIPHWLDTQDRRKHLTLWIDSTIGRICQDRWISMYGTAIAVNAVGFRGMQRSESFDLYLYQRNHGKIFQWILWSDYRSAKGLMQYGSW